MRKKWGKKKIEETWLASSLIGGKNGEKKKLKRLGLSHH